MNFQILPNWCKKLGVILFLIGAIGSFYEGFSEGIHSSRNDVESIVHPNHSNCIYNYIHFFSLLEVLGMMIYIMSKEKVEDDYINVLRLESYQLTFFINIVIALFLFVFKKEMNVEFDFYLSSFLLIYLITFAIKKREY
ncbi:hypothetical protein [Tenacibaculum sp. IB213877]|uniref:hypothetical protein n=1 Tax=Tenacibaculum sp. IB213877 TaxID=3097351 RepID=UPI002A5A3066|nr:hypothetical protein [Tenacibaculum sp. IB213877]MDY0780556.1 hypothetical protein [Tenacibaculum sp. IB213877]